jgi:hypothetical protein
VNLAFLMRCAERLRRVAKEEKPQRKSLRISQDILIFWQPILRWLCRALGVACVLAGVLVKADLQGLDGLGLRIDQAHLRELAQLLFPLLLIVVPALESLRRWMERKTLWPLVKDVLEEFRKQLCPREDLHRIRVTLFKRSRWVFRIRFLKRPGWGWLKIVERSGHTSQNSRTVFFAPNDPDRAEGVAGLAWAWNTVVIREDLPDVKSGSPKESQWRNYAAGSNASVDLVKELRPGSRSLCGIPVEVSGRVWGVLVVDGRDPKLPSDKIQQHYSIVAKFLSRILEKV